MNRNKYSLLHQKLLYHWTQPDGLRQNANKESNKKFIPKPLPRSMVDRLALIAHLKSILKEGLRYGIPKDSHTEKITDLIQTTHRLVSLSEWSVSDSTEQAYRYGHLGLGFTRKYIMSQDGRPVIYIHHQKSDPIRKAMIKLLESSSKDRVLDDHAQVVASLLKLYKDPRKPRISDGERRERREGRTPDGDRIFALEFGGIHGNLEDREWRILDVNSQDDKPRALLCEPGKLAMIVMPDHKTLSLALKDDFIRDMVLPKDKPAICIMSREMLRSI